MLLRAANISFLHTVHDPDKTALASDARGRNVCRCHCPGEAGSVDRSGGTGIICRVQIGVDLFNLGRLNPNNRQFLPELVVNSFRLFAHQMLRSLSRSSHRKIYFGCSYLSRPLLRHAMLLDRGNRRHETGGLSHSLIRMKVNAGQRA